MAETAVDTAVRTAVETADPTAVETTKEILGRTTENEQELEWCPNVYSFCGKSRLSSIQYNVQYITHTVI